MSSQHDWSLVQPKRKWHILARQKRFALWAIYTSVGCMMMGFDWGIAGTATAYPAFQKVMGKPYPSQPSGYLISASIQSAWSAVATGGDLVGVAISGQLMERIGRKHTIIVGVVLTAAGIGVQIGSKGPHAWKVFLAGRLVNALGFGMTFIISPVWIGENVRPELRGLFLCLQNGSIVFGQFLLALIAYGTQNMSGHWPYKTLVILQFAFVLTLAMGYPFFPESPYYLLKNKDEDGARQSLRRVHGGDDHNLIEAEIARMKEMIATNEELASQADQKGHPILQIWQGTNLKRTIISFLGPIGQQFIGAAFVLGYITYFLSLLGIQEYFKVSVALYCVMLASNISAFPLIEIIGRRPLLVYGMIALTVTELIMGIMGTIMNAAALWVILVCIFLWAIFYQCSIGAVGFALAAEVPSAPLRPTTISVSTILGGFVGWLIGFVSPYMINPDAGDLGAKVGFVFAGFGVPLCVAFWFLIPETLGLQFEGIDAMFLNRVPPRRFRREAAIRRQSVNAGLADNADPKFPTATTIESASA